MSAPARCSWCGEDVPSDDGWRAYEPSGARAATFCRLEHAFPWAFHDSHWEAGELEEPDLDQTERCAECDAELGEVRVLLVRHRGSARIPDAFCSTDHMARWAKAGGRWRSA